MKLGFWERIHDTKNLKLHKGLRAEKLRRENAIKLSFKKFFQFKREVRVLGKNLGHQGFRALEGINTRRIEKKEHDELSFKKCF